MYAVVPRQWMSARQAAAVRLQAWYRGRRVRRWYVRLRRAVTQLQAAARGLLLRRALARALPGHCEVRRAHGHTVCCTLNGGCLTYIYRWKTDSCPTILRLATVQCPLVDNYLFQG